MFSVSVLCILEVKCPMKKSKITKWNLHSSILVTETDILPMHRSLDKTNQQEVLRNDYVKSQVKHTVLVRTTQEIYLGYASVCYLLSGHNGFTETLTGLPRRVS